MFLNIIGILFVQKNFVKHKNIIYQLYGIFIFFYTGFKTKK